MPGGGRREKGCRAQGSGGESKHNSLREEKLGEGHIEFPEGDLIPGTRRGRGVGIRRPDHRLQPSRAWGPRKARAGGVPRGRGAPARCRCRQAPGPAPPRVHSDFLGPFFSSPLVTRRSPSCRPPGLPCRALLPAGTPAAASPRGRSPVSGSQRRTPARPPPLSPSRPTHARRGTPNQSPQKWISPRIQRGPVLGAALKLGFLRPGDGWDL